MMRTRYVDRDTRYFVSTRGVGVSWRAKRRPLVDMLGALLLLAVAVGGLILVLFGT